MFCLAPGDFDRFSVDCPFVFRHEGRFYMTYVGFDGIGYQTGLASSYDLVHWTKEGCILRRNPASPITRYNIAMNWIIRENGLHTIGRLTPFTGDFIGAYHAYPREGYEQCFRNARWPWHNRFGAPDVDDFTGGLRKRC